MKSKSLKRIITAALALSLLLALCACGGGNGGDKGEKIRLEHVYSVEYLDAELPEGFDANNVFTSGGILYLNGYYYRELPNEQYESGYALYSIDLDTKELKLVFNNKDNYSAYEDENATSYSSSNLSNFTPDADGNIWAYKSEYFEDWSDPENYIYTNTGYIVCLNSAGEEIKNFPLDEIFADEEYYYIDQMMLSPDGDLVIMGNQRILCLSAENGSLKSDVDLDEQQYIYSLTTTGAGDIVAISNTYDQAAETSTTSFLKLDPATGKFEDLGTTPLVNMYNMIPGPDSSVYINSNSSVYQYDITSKELNERLNWINSDINYNRINNICALPDGRLAAIERDRNYSNPRIMLLTPKPDSEVTEKYLLSYAAMYADDNVMEAIIQFNKTNDEYRIQYLDYSKYSTDKDWQGGYTQLNNDIIAGKIPDIMALESLPFNSYVSKGLLMDLGALMDADESFNRADYLENVLAATAVNGSIYSLIPYFYIQTVIGKSENVGTEMGWTIDDLKALMARFPEASVFSETDKSSALSYFSSMALDQFINYDTGVCSFNSSDFTGLLELINTFPDEIDWESLYGEDSNWWELYESQYRDDRTLLMITSLSAYNRVRDLIYNFGSDDFTFIGFPTSSGIGSTIIPSGEVGISSKTKHADACWDFVKYMLSDEFQETVTWGLPVKLSRLEELANEAMSDTGYDGGGVIMPVSGGDMAVVRTVDDDDVTDDDTAEPATDGDLAADTPAVDPGYNSYDDIYSRPITQAQIDKMNELIYSVTAVTRSNEAIMNIISEEAAAYFEGQKTAAAVAEIIQSKVSIYVSENS